MEGGGLAGVGRMAAGGRLGILGMMDRMGSQEIVLLVADWPADQTHCCCPSQNQNPSQSLS